MQAIIPTSLRHWIEASRPKTLWVSVCPIILAISISVSKNIVHIPTLITALFCSLLIQIGCNLANDYYDYKKGADANRVGPKRMASSNLIPPQKIKNAFIGCLVFAMILGTYLIYLGGPIISIIGISAIGMAVLYTAGPFALAYTGLADIVAFLYFGPIAVVGVTFIESKIWHTESWVLGSCLGCFAVAILTVNNLRDHKTDNLADKRSLTVRFGTEFGKLEYTIMMITPFTVAILWQLTQNNRIGLVLLILLPQTINLIKAIHNNSEGNLNPYLEKTAQLALIFTLVLSGTLLV